MAALSLMAILTLGFPCWPDITANLLTVLYQFSRGASFTTFLDNTTTSTTTTTTATILCYFARPQPRTRIARRLILQEPPPQQHTQVGLHEAVTETIEAQPLQGPRFQGLYTRESTQSSDKWHINRGL
ncbi:hypothetical protein BJ875DRAFT_217876 [Amylocarpus encephaloides]|uniref:Uncharacterized protein n=1 Tax=Amylocarpus encephaloides TaxID=45428 RepID=A0A9P7YP62_9HELO|nr:hypothetical protein BJ875DRAFT_217876 [Amylocarpus encephaloides]